MADLGSWTRAGGGASVRYRSRAFGLRGGGRREVSRLVGGRLGKALGHGHHQGRGWRPLEHAACHGMSV